MGRKSGQGLLNGLLVADIHQHPFKHRHLAVVPYGDQQAALGHDCQQTQCFQRHRLTTRVGAGDNQRIKLASQLYVNGNHLFRVNEGMAGTTQASMTIGGQRRLNSLHLIGQMRLGKDNIEFQQHLVIRNDGGSKTANLG